MTFSAASWERAGEAARQALSIVHWLRLKGTRTKEFRAVAVFFGGLGSDFLSKTIVEMGAVWEISVTFAAPNKNTAYD